MFPRGNQIEEHAILDDALTGQAHANEVLRQCHETGREIDGYGGRCITHYPVSENILLRFTERMNEDDNEI